MSESGNQESGDDRRKQARFGLQCRGDRERHGERQRDDAYRDAGADIRRQRAPVVSPQALQQLREEGVERYSD